VTRIEVYTFEDANGNEVSSYTTQNPGEARDYAQTGGYRVRSHIYEWTDSELVAEWDFTRSAS
jgi:hypothetical protein